MAGRHATIVDIGSRSAGFGQLAIIEVTGHMPFELATPQGIAYTLNGSMRIDEQGRLVDATGNSVAGLAGELRFSSSNPVIGRDGRIYEKGQQTGQLKIVHFENPQYALWAIGEGLYQPREERVAQEVSRIQVLQGHLESSNVYAMRDKTFRSLGQF